LFEVNADRTEITHFDDEVFRVLLSALSKKPVTKHEEIFENYSELDHMVGGTRLRPYLSVQDFADQLTVRHQLFATTLYELVKYHKPMSYLTYRSNTMCEGDKPRFHKLYSKYTHDYRDIVLQYYPRDFHGFALVNYSLKHHPMRKESFFDIKKPVYEWANVPPPDINNVPRNINLPTF
jgi:hypothetical protein